MGALAELGLIFSNVHVWHYQGLVAWWPRTEVGQFCSSSPSLQFDCESHRELRGMQSPDIVHLKYKLSITDGSVVHDFLQPNSSEPSEQSTMPSQTSLR